MQWWERGAAHAEPIDKVLASAAAGHATARNLQPPLIHSSRGSLALPPNVSPSTLHVDNAVSPRGHRCLLVPVLLFNVLFQPRTAVALFLVCVSLFIISCHFVKLASLTSHGGCVNTTKCNNSELPTLTKKASNNTVLFLWMCYCVTVHKKHLLFQTFMQTYLSPFQYSRRYFSVCDSVVNNLAKFNIIHL